MLHDEACPLLRARLSRHGLSKAEIVAAECLAQLDPFMSAEELAVAIRRRVESVRQYMYSYGLNARYTRIRKSSEEVRKKEKTECQP